MRLCLKNKKKLRCKDDLYADILGTEYALTGACPFIGIKVDKSFMNSHFPMIHVELPSPSGLFLHGTTNFFVGSGTGPQMLTPVFTAISLTCEHILSSVMGLVPDN